MQPINGWGNSGFGGFGNPGLNGTNGFGSFGSGIYGGAGRGPGIDYDVESYNPIRPPACPIQQHPQPIGVPLAQPAPVIPTGFTQPPAALQPTFQIPVQTQPVFAAPPAPAPALAPAPLPAAPGPSDDAGTKRRTKPKAAAQSPPIRKRVQRPAPAHYKVTFTKRERDELVNAVRILNALIAALPDEDA